MFYRSFKFYCFLFFVSFLMTEVSFGSPQVQSNGGKAEQEKQKTDTQKKQPSHKKKVEAARAFFGYTGMVIQGKINKPDIVDRGKEVLEMIPKEFQSTFAFRLTKSALEDKKPKEVYFGTKIPNPKTRHALTLLHPTKMQAVHVCDKGIIEVVDLENLNSPGTIITTTTAEPLGNGTFSGDGKIFAAGDSKGNVTFFNTEDWKEKSVLKTGLDYVSYLALNKDGSRLVVTNKSGTALWDVEKSKEIVQLQGFLMFGGSFAFSKDGKTLSSGGKFDVDIWDAKTGKKLETFKQSGYTMHQAFSSDGNLVASGLRGGINKWVGIYNRKKKEWVFQNKKLPKGCTGMQFLDDDRTLLTTFSGGRMVFWDTQTGIPLMNILHPVSIYQPFVNKNQNVLLWNSRKGARFYVLKQ